MGKDRRAVKYWASILFRCVGLGIFCVFLIKADLRNVASLISGAAVAWLAVAVGLQIGMMLCKSLRWWYLLRVAGLHLRWRDVTAIFLAGYFCGVLTPGRLGEFIRIGYLKSRANCSFTTAFLNVFVDRLLDLVFFVYCGFLGLAWLGLVPWFVFGLMCLAGILAYGLAMRRVLRAKLAAAVGWLARRTRKDYRDEHFEQAFSQTLTSVKGRHFVWVSLLTILSNAVGFFGSVYCLAKSLALDVHYLDVSGGVAANGVLALLPITVGGLGTREAVFSYVFGARGIGTAEVVAFCALTVAFVVLLPALGCLPFYLGLSSAARSEREATELQR